MITVERRQLAFPRRGQPSPYNISPKKKKKRRKRRRRKKSTVQKIVGCKRFDHALAFLLGCNVKSRATKIKQRSLCFQTPVHVAFVALLFGNCPLSSSDVRMSAYIPMYPCANHTACTFLTLHIIHWFNERGVKEGSGLFYLPIKALARFPVKEQGVDFCQDLFAQRRCDDND